MTKAPENIWPVYKCTRDVAGMVASDFKNIKEEDCSPGEKAVVLLVLGWGTLALGSAALLADTFIGLPVQAVVGASRRFRK